MQGFPCIRVDTNC